MWIVTVWEVIKRADAYIRDCSVNHGMQTGWDYCAKTVPRTECRGTVATVLTNPRIFFENHKKSLSTQQSHSTENIRDCIVIDNSKGYL